MIRMFENHKIRFQKELSGYYDFTLVDSSDILPESYDYKMFVPSCWESDIRFVDYRGRGVYRKTLGLDKTANVRLEFKGVSHTADVYWNGNKIAHHYNAYTGFSTIIPEAPAGKHELVVVVDNSFSEASSLHIPNDYYTYGGITKPVVLETIPDVYIRYVHFTPRYTDGKWSANIRILLENISDTAHIARIKLFLDEKDIKNALLDTAFNIESKSNKTIEIEAEFENVSEWAPESPILYLLNTMLFLDGNEAAADDLIERVGFRTIEVKGSDILLNGRKIFIQGFNRHEDHPAGGCSITPELAAQDIALMTDLGANSVRTSHYPNDERFLDMCDEKGILVWEESHARGLSLEQMLNPNFEKQCIDCINEMINDHYNHPSIYVWGILNECDSTSPKGKEIYARLFAQIKSLDKSRPVTFATNKHFEDICFDLVDIVSLNLYYGWYIQGMRSRESIEEAYLQELEWVNNTPGKGKPIIISEFGAGALYGYRTPIQSKWSEERQAEILDHTLSIYLNRPEISGAYIWQFCDVRITEGKYEMLRPRLMNNKGVVDEYRRPKLAYGTVKKHFTRLNDEFVNY